MKFLIIGGDLRNRKLIEILRKDGHELEDYIEINNYKLRESIKEKNFDAVIGPIPFTNDEETLNASFSKEKCHIDQLIPFLEGQTLIAGPISGNLINKMQKYNIKAIDIMEHEELVIYNTIATAEGTIEIAIANTEKNLHESKILILGFGRVAKTLAVKLKCLSRSVTCAARKISDFAWINTLGLNIQNINNLDNNLKEYDIIINTVPQIILTDEKIKKINENTLIIDLASNPGGVDQESIKKTSIKYIWASGIPRKSCTTFISTIYKKSNL